MDAKRDVNLIVRYATIEDLTALVDIEQKSFDDPWSELMISSAIRHHDADFLVAEIEGLVVGYLCYNNVAGEVNILGIAVLPDFRQTGIGGIMLGHLIDIAKRHEAIGITLECRVSNEPAIALYKKYNFVNEGIRAGYYDDGEDAYIMWLRFGMIVLAIETSCDETSCAILRGERDLLANVVHSQIDLHQVYGGVVPEIASRNHLLKIRDVTRAALKDAGIGLEDVDAIAATRGPGLIGALLVGLTYSKALAYSLSKPFIGIHHIEGHIAANYLVHETLKPPYLCLVVSGGHTHLVNVKSYTRFEVIGRTLDDAVGEAYDKIARVLGLGYPGGPAVEREALKGEPSIAFPNPRVEGFDFSFSGLKTAVLNYINAEKQRGNKVNVQDVCASFQKAVIDILRTKTEEALRQTGHTSFALAGGVAANKSIRKALRFDGVESFYPPLSLCTDNAAMIASAAHYYLREGYTSPLNVNASPSIKIGESFE